MKIRPTRVIGAAGSAKRHRYGKLSEGRFRRRRDSQVLLEPFPKLASMQREAALLGPGTFVRWQLKQHDALSESAPVGVGTIISIDSESVAIDVYDGATGRPKRLWFDLDDIDLQLERRVFARNLIARIRVD